MQIDTYDEVVGLLRFCRPGEEMTLAAAINTLMAMTLQDRMGCAIVRQNHDPILYREEMEAIYWRPDFPRASRRPG